MQSPCVVSWNSQRLTMSAHISLKTGYPKSTGWSYFSLSDPNNSPIADLQLSCISSWSVTYEYNWTILKYSPPYPSFRWSNPQFCGEKSPFATFLSHYYHGIHVESHCIIASLVGWTTSKPPLIWITKLYPINPTISHIIAIVHSQINIKSHGFSVSGLELGKQRFFFPFYDYPIFFHHIQCLCLSHICQSIP